MSGLDWLGVMVLVVGTNALTLWWTQQQLCGVLRFAAEQDAKTAAAAAEWDRMTLQALR